MATYLNYFNLTATPFSIAPDPKFLFLSDRHREGLAHLLYGVGEDGGFVLLTGEVGTGKTTLCRSLLEQIPENVDLAFIFNPKLTATELLATLIDEFGFAAPDQKDSLKALTDAISAGLLARHAAGRNCVVLVDEAQNLAPDVLEQLRLLTNLETNERKLLRIILLGQPELRDALRNDELRQLTQRITARYHLDPLNEQEANAYIAHRLERVGGSLALFSRSARKRIFKLTGGTPRLINVLCDRALLGAFIEGRGQVDPGIVKRAASEVLDTRQGVFGRMPKFLIASTMLTIFGLSALATAFWWPQGTERPDLPDALASEPINLDGADRSASKAPQAEVSTPGSANRGNSEPLEPLAANPAVSTNDTMPTAASASQLSNTWQLPIKSEKNQAWAALLNRWGLMGSDYPDCEALGTATNLRCLNWRGSWAGLRSLERPAMLELLGNDGKTLYATVLEATPDSITVWIGGEQHNISPAQLDNYWRGGATLVWARPPGRIVLVEGRTDTSVAYLRERLRQLGFTNTATSDRFDTQLRKDLTNFQASARLETDGIAGAETWIALANALSAQNRHATAGSVGSEGIDGAPVHPQLGVTQKRGQE